MGEAPGESENVIGKPFVGPAGKLLDRIIREALPADTSYCLTNLVGCIPREDTGKKAQEPSREEIKACMPRLIQFVQICNPSFIVCVGSLASTWLDPKCQLFRWNGPTVSIVHPAFILRSEPTKQGLLIQQAIVKITERVTGGIPIVFPEVLRLAINVYDLERANPPKELALGRRLSQEIVWIDKNKKEEKALPFVCDLITAATICDIIRNQARKDSKYPPRVYVKKRDWKRLKESDYLTIVNNGTVILNPEVFQ